MTPEASFENRVPVGGALLPPGVAFVLVPAAVAFPIVHVQHEARTAAARLPPHVGHRGAEAPGVGWYVKTCTPGELFSLLAGPCARVEWVALDPRPGRSGGEAANVMPRENFVDYLSCSHAPLWLRGYEPETTGGDPHGRENDR